MQNTLIVIPDVETLTKRLENCKDVEAVKRGLYPLLLKQCGQEKYPIGIILLIELAICDYLKAADFPPVMGVLVRAKMPEYIRAFVTDDTQCGIVMQALASLDQQ